MPSTGIDPPILLPLNRRSKQLSYAAPKITIICCFSKRFLIKTYTIKSSLSLRTFIKLLKFSNNLRKNLIFFTSKLQKFGQRLGARLLDPRFSCTTVTKALLKKNTRRLSCMLLYEFIIFAFHA